MTEDPGKSPQPPYIPFRAFFNLLTHLEEGVPQRIDRSFWSRHYSGGTGVQLVAGLRFLRLIEGQTNVSTPRLKQLVNEKSSRKQLLGELLRERYTPIFEYVGDLSTATPAMLDEAFKDNYDIRDDTLRKAISFFIHAAKEAEIPISKLITDKIRSRSVAAKGSVRTNGKNGRKPQPSRRPGKASQPVDAPKGEMPRATSQQTSAASGNTKTIILRRGEPLMLTYGGDMFNIDKYDRELVLRLIDLMDSHVQEMSNGDAYDEDMEEEDNE